LDLKPPRTETNFESGRPGKRLGATVGKCPIGRRYFDRFGVYCESLEESRFALIELCRLDKG
jgi:hypothetical protein